jgi:predicted flap endonuclease-1-like 5' DNA nuclease
MTGAAAKRIAAAAVVLIAAVLLRYAEVPPFPTWLYVFAWYPTLYILDQAVVLLGGESLLAQPRALGAMLGWSAVIWFVFEAINFRLQDWYYVFLPAGRLERWVGITLSLATVVPAVLLPERLLDRLGVWRELRSRPLALPSRDPGLALWLGAVTLGFVLAFPRQLYPLTWVALWLIAEPLLYARDPARSLFRDIARGSWGRIARLMAGGLFAGILWESFNGLARARWIYTVPFLEHVKVVEMPPIGFLGFPLFALEVWSLYHLLAPRATRATVSAAVTFALLTLAGMDAWTVSSTAPRWADLPGVTNAVLYRLRDAGWTDVCRIARASVAELAYSANLSPEDARAAHDAARLAALTGIGTAHAAALIGGGLGTVEALARADPDSVWRIVHHSARPTRAEVGVWIRAAQAATGSPTPLH